MIDNKTNVMRILESCDISYQPHLYDWNGKDAPDGLTVAATLNVDPGQIFKTLVVRGATKSYYVFEVPVNCTLDLKKAAKSVGEKSIEMIHLKELFPLTGYIHGGCSPIGMKKSFPIIFDETCILFDSIFLSAGKIGYQIEVAPMDVISFLNAKTDDISV